MMVVPTAKTSAGKVSAIPDIQVLILAGGKGERLRPLSIGCPKTLVPVCNRPVLGWLLDSLVDAGIARAQVTLPYLNEEVEVLLQETTPKGFRLDAIVPQGRFGGSYSAVAALRDPAYSAVMVIYGDSLLRADLASLLRAHLRARECGGLATILYHRPHDLYEPESEGRTYHGVLSVDSAQRVTRFTEKPLVRDIGHGFDLANAAVFVCEPGLFDHPAFQTATDFSFHVFEPCVQGAIAPIYGCDIAQGFRLDIGSCGRFFEMNVQVLNGRWQMPIAGSLSRPAVWLGTDVQCDGANIIPPVLIGDAVRVAAGATVGPNVILGKDCLIGQNARIQNAVLLHDCCVAENAVLNYCILGTASSVTGKCVLPKYAVIAPYSTLGGTEWPNWRVRSKT